ncbi:MAG TPA: hypothetical protein VFP94_10005 [Terriglobales bacterium]|nr:hypothetical protein [Terriglobales bacterium]
MPTAFTIVRWARNRATSPPPTPHPRKLSCSLISRGGGVLLLACALLAAGSAQQPAPPPAPTPALQQRLLGAFQVDQRALLTYSHREHVTVVKDGKTQRTTTRVWYVHGRAVNETTARNGVPLTDSEQTLEHSYALKRAQAAAQRPAPPIGELEFSGRSYPFSRLAHDYLFQPLATRLWNGRTTWVYEASPNPDAKARSREEKLLLHSAGEVWVDVEDQHVVRIQIHATSPVRYGFGLLAVVHEADLLLELQRIQPGVWLPQTTAFHAQATVLMVDSIARAKEQLAYDYQPLEAARMEPLPGN